MLINHDEEKTLNAIVFFAQNIPNLTLTKLYHLLFILDFRHFSQTGRSVTGLEYHTTFQGIVPLDLKQKIDNILSKNNLEIIS